MPTDPALEITQPPLWRRPNRADWDLVARPDGWAGPLVDRIATIAAAAGLWPADLPDRPSPTGPDGLTQLATARQWAPATHTLYAKALRVAGIPVDIPPTPEPAPLSGPWPLLWANTTPAASPTRVRAALWARLTTTWAADIARWATLPTRAVTRHGDHVHLAVDDMTLTCPDAGPLLTAWTAARDRRHATRHAPTLLCTLRPGPAGSRAGQPMRGRTLRHAFAAHARAVAHAAASHPDHHVHAATLATLTYDSWRRTCAAAGAATPGRGAVRAARHPGPAIT